MKSLDGVLSILFRFGGDACGDAHMVEEYGFFGGLFVFIDLAKDKRDLWVACRVVFQDAFIECSSARYAVVFKEFICAREGGVYIKCIFR